DSNTWIFTTGWGYNPIFECCSFLSPKQSLSDNNITFTTLVNGIDLNPFISNIDQGDQALKLSMSYFTSHGPSSSSLVPTQDAFQVITRFLDSSGNYMT